MRMIITNTKIVNPYDIGVLHIRNGFVFLQETIKRADAVTVLGHLPQYFQNDLQVRRLTLRQIYAGMLR